MSDELLHDRDTLFEECLNLSLKQINQSGEKGRNKWKNNLNHSAIDIEPVPSTLNDNKPDFFKANENENERSIHSNRKSAFDYLNRIKRDDGPAPRSVICKKRRKFRDEYNNDCKPHKFQSPFNVSLSKVYLNSHNDISISLNHSSNEYDSDNNNQLNNPFDSIDDNRDKDSTISHHYSKFNTNCNNYKYHHRLKQYPPTDLIYEAPKYSNDALNQLKLFNPNDERSQDSQSDNKENSLKNNKKLMSAFTITQPINHSSKTKNILNDSEIEDLKYKSIVSMLDDNSHMSTSFHYKRPPINDAYSIQSISLKGIKNYDHPFQSPPSNESRNDDISSRILGIINNNEFSSLLLKLKSITLISPPITFSLSASIEQDMLIEAIDKEFYSNQIEFSSFKTITSNLHNQVSYSQESPIGNKKQFNTLKQYLIPVNPLNDELNNLNINKASKLISHYRQVLCDGDGFYRAFAFALMEHLFLNTKQEQLKAILYNITIKSKEAFKYNNVDIDTKTVVIISKIILTHIENNEFRKAFKVFTNAFLTEKKYELGLIKYIKVAIAECVKLNFSKVSKENQLLLFPMKYFSNNYNCLDIIEYINERILRMNYEPDACVYFFAPIAFNINVQFIAFEKQNTFITQNSPSSMIQKEKEKDVICIMYNCARYYIGYYHQDKFKRNNKPKHTNAMIINPKKKARRFDIIARKVNCATCHTESDVIALNLFQSKPFCKQCLLNILNEASNLLSDYFVKDDYKHIEYYCQPITILQNSDDDYAKEIKIYDEDFIELSGQSMPNALLKRVQQKCIECNRVLSIESNVKAIALSCNCYYCYDCFNIKIETAFPLLNPKPKKTFGSKLSLKQLKLNCKCGADIKLSNIIPILLQDSSNNLAQEKAITIELMGKQCFVCLRHTNHNRFKVIDRLSSLSYSHVLCFECQKSHKRNNNTVSRCIYCDEYHSLLVTSSIGKKKQFCDVNCCLII